MTTSTANFNRFAVLLPYGPAGSVRTVEREDELRNGFHFILRQPVVGHHGWH